MGTPTNPKRILGFVGRVTIVHVVSYFIAGAIFSTFFNYAAMYSKPEMACFMQPMSSPGWLSPVERRGSLFPSPR